MPLKIIIRIIVFLICVIIPVTIIAQPPADVIIQNITINTDTVFAATNSVVAGPNFTINSEGVVALVSEEIVILKPPFNVLNGGTLNVLMGDIVNEPFSGPLELIEYDNGFPNNSGYQQIPGDQIALRMTPSQYPFSLKSIFINIADINPVASSSDSFGIRIYDDDGWQNAPGTIILDNLTAAAPEFILDNANSWVVTDVSSSSIIIPDGDFYISVIWLESNTPQLAIEKDLPNELRSWIYENGNWNRIADLYPSMSNNQAMIRALGVVDPQHTIQHFAYDNSFPDNFLSQPNPGDQIALKITPHQYNEYLDAILVNVTNYGYEISETDSFEVRVYGNSLNDEPGDLLLSGIKAAAKGDDRSDVSSPFLNDWILIDVSTHNILVDGEDFYISIAWLSPSSPSIGCDIRSSDHRTWINENNSWTLLDVAYPGISDNQIMIRAICSPDGTIGVAENPQLPEGYNLKQNYPNPFNPSTTIRYGLPEDSNVSLVIYDLRGNVVQTMTSEHQSAGWYNVVWSGETTDGKSISTGIYFARLVAGDYSQVIKMLYLK